MTSPLSPKEPWERSGYSEIFEEFYLRKVNMGKILSVGGPGVGILQTEGFTDGGIQPPAPQAGHCLNQLLIPPRGISSPEGSCDLVEALDVRAKGGEGRLVTGSAPFTEEEVKDQGGVKVAELVNSTVQMFPGQKFQRPALVM